METDQHQHGTVISEPRSEGTEFRCWQCKRMIFKFWQLTGIVEAVCPKCKKRLLFKFTGK